MNDGIVVGADAQYEWMLPWWIKHYSKHNEYPICFADFGMTSLVRKFCAINGILIDLTYKASKNWFKKPAAMLACGFGRMIWVDLDCEVRGSLAPILEYASRGLAITLDPYNRWCKNQGVIASGVVGATKDNDLLKLWADKCLSTKLRGDQEVLNSITNATDPRVVVMPREYQWLRLDGDNKNAIIMHWTGPIGKKHILTHIKDL